MHNTVRKGAEVYMWSLPMHMYTSHVPVHL